MKRIALVFALFLIAATAGIVHAYVPVIQSHVTHADWRASEILCKSEIAKFLDTRQPTHMLCVCLKEWLPGRTITGPPWAAPLWLILFLVFGMPGGLFLFPWLFEKLFDEAEFGLIAWFGVLLFLLVGYPMLVVKELSPEELNHLVNLCWQAIHNKTLTEVLRIELQRIVKEFRVLD